MSQLQNQLVCLTQSALSSQSNPKNITSRTSRTWREIYSGVSQLSHMSVDFYGRVRFSARHTSCIRVRSLAEAFGFHGRRRRVVVVDSVMGRFSAQERKNYAIIPSRQFNSFAFVALLARVKPGKFQRGATIRWMRPIGRISFRDFLMGFSRASLGIRQGIAPSLSPAGPQ